MLSNLLLPVKVNFEVRLVRVDHRTLDRHRRSVELDRRQPLRRIFSVENRNPDWRSENHREVLSVVEMFWT